MTMCNHVPSAACALAASSRQYPACSSCHAAFLVLVSSGAGAVAVGALVFCSVSSSTGPTTTFSISYCFLVVIVTVLERVVCSITTRSSSRGNCTTLSSTSSMSTMHGSRGGKVFGTNDEEQESRCRGGRGRQRN